MWLGIIRAFRWALHAIDSFRRGIADFEGRDLERAASIETLDE
jgi:hypothetical protein